MGGKSGDQTIGYRYFMSLHMGLGRGPLNEIAEIRVGDLTAYSAPIDLSTSGKLVTINRPNLFGGEKKEGGIQGPMYVYNGARDQELQPALSSSLGTLPAIASKLGGDVPSFRGVVTCWFDGMICAMNPYPKEWSFRVRRSDAGWWEDTPWYPSKAKVLLMSEGGKPIHAMNGAHMLYEINTNPEWGRGMPPELLDENSYIVAANTLCAEGVGLCMPWFRQESIKEFIPIIINHIGGVQYVDRETGKLTLRLIRNDYDPETLPLFTPETGLLDVVDDDSSGEETAYNEIVVKGFDPTTKEEIMVRVHNLASIQSQGEIISNTIEYKGFPTRKLVAQAAFRELKVQLPLRKMSVVLDRRGWRLAPGMPFRISHPGKGIGNIILRAGECQDGTLVDGKITIKAVQDIFGMPDTLFVDPPGSVWTPPNRTAAPSPETRLDEIDWRSFYRVSSQAERDAVDIGTSFIAVAAKDVPNVLTSGYELWTKTGTEDYASRGGHGFTTWLTLAVDIGPLDTTFEVEQDNRADFMTEYEAGMVVLIDDEQIQLVTFDDSTGEGTLLRGVADTIPAAHVAGETIWLIDDERSSDLREYQDGETVNAKVLTRTSSDMLALTSATELSRVMDQRVFRPYPPGDVRVDGLTIYDLDDEERASPELTWTHRDRIAQADVPVGHGAASVGPEVGVTYTVRVYQSNGTTLINTYDGIAGTSWEYDSTLQAADGNPFVVVMELVSTRDGVDSYFPYRFTIVLNAASRLMVASGDELASDLLLLSGDEQDTGADNELLSGDEA